MGLNRPKPTISTPARRRPRLRILAGMAAHGLFSCALIVPLAQAAPAALAQAADEQRYYDIPAGPLTEALNRYGRESGLMLSFSTGQTHGLQSKGIKGRYTAQQGLQALLADTGFEAAARPSGGYVLRPAGAQVLSAVEVIGTQERPTRP